MTTRLRRFTTYPGETGLNKLLTQYKSNAKVRNMVFSLSKEQFKHLTSSNCTYCDDEPSKVFKLTGSVSDRVSKHSHYKYNGIDRVDNSLPYTADNSVSCCGRCNWMKLDMSFDAFKTHVIKIFKKLSTGDI